LRLIRVSLLAAGLAAVPGATAADAPKLEYQPSEAVLKNPKPSFDALNAVPIAQIVIERSDGSGSRAKLARTGWRNTRVVVAFDAQVGAPGAIEYESLGEIGAVREGAFLSQRWGVPLPSGWTLWCENSESERCAKALADVLFVYRARVRGMREADRLFGEVLAKYKHPAQRPPLPEDVRKFKIQAEFAVDQKKLADAINYYTQGVVGARWWADGYFNLALLHAEVKNFPEAIRVMKRFIALQEGTPDARRAMDMTYRWEAMIPADQRE
jgi:hypothetical protein